MAGLVIGASGRSGYLPPTARPHRIVGHNYAMREIILQCQHSKLAGLLPLAFLHLNRRCDGNQEIRACMELWGQTPSTQDPSVGSVASLFRCFQRWALLSTSDDSIKTNGQVAT